MSANARPIAAWPMAHQGHRRTRAVSLRCLPVPVRRRLSRPRDGHALHIHATRKPQAGSRFSRPRRRRDTPMPRCPLCRILAGRAAALSKSVAKRQRRKWCARRGMGRAPRHPCRARGGQSPRLRRASFFSRCIGPLPAEVRRRHRRRDASRARYVPPDVSQRGVADKDVGTPSHEAPFLQCLACQYSTHPQHRHKRVSATL